MSCTAFTYGVHLEQLPEELHDLPDKAHKAALVAKVGTFQPGESVEFTIYRRGNTEKITVVIGEKIQPAS